MYWKGKCRKGKRTGKAQLLEGQVSPEGKVPSGQMSYGIYQYDIFDAVYEHRYIKIYNQNSARKTIRGEVYSAKCPFEKAYRRPVIRRVNQ